MSATGRQIGWYRLYDMGELGIQIMHYKLDGTPGQCCTVSRDRLQANIDALERDWFGYWRRHEAPFAWEPGRASMVAAEGCQ